MKIILPLLMAACASAQTDPEFERFKREAFKKEDEGAWKRIRWHRDIAEALAQAGRDHRPILVFLVVGERGRKNAPEC
jgi:hypothetical protein